MKYILLSISVFCWFFGSGATYYVATSGNDNNAGTEGSPYLTIAKGVSVLVAGDVLIVDDGNYNITGSQIANITQDGTSSNWITIKSKNKYGAKIIGKKTGTMDYEVGFQLTGANYIKIEGFQIQDVSFAGIRALDGVNSNIEIRDVKISTVGDICVDTFYGLCGIVFDKVTNALVERCWVENVGRRATEEGCTNPDDNYKNHDHGIYINGCTNITVKNSVFNKINHGQGIHIYSSGGLSSTGVNILNNTFYDGNRYSTQAAGHIILWGHLSNTVIANNIFHTQYNSGIYVYQGSYTYSNVLITKNMTYGGTGTTTDGTATGVTISSNYNSTNPLFTNASTKDFSLLSSSPAINVGYATGVTTDFNNNTRDSNIDTGAFEYIVPVPPDQPTSSKKPISTGKKRMSGGKKILTF